MISTVLGFANILINKFNHVNISFVPYVSSSMLFAEMAL